MKFEAFKAGNWVQQYQYKSFSPVPINQEWNWASALLKKMVSDGILTEITGYQRNRVFMFPRYLELFSD